MEKIKSICMLREIYQAIASFETEFAQMSGMGLNEAMVLCTLKEGGREMTPTALAQQLGMTASHTSKVVSAVERKGFVKRSLGHTDRRQMFCSLTAAGREKLESLSDMEIEIPEIFEPILAETGISSGQ